MTIDRCAELIAECQEQIEEARDIDSPAWAAAFKNRKTWLELWLVRKSEEEERR